MEWNGLRSDLKLLPHRLFNSIHIDISKSNWIKNLKGILIFITDQWSCHQKNSTVACVTWKQGSANAVHQPPAACCNGQVVSVEDLEESGKVLRSTQVWWWNNFHEMSPRQLNVIACSWRNLNSNIRASWFSNPSERSKLFFCTECCSRRSCYWSTLPLLQTWPLAGRMISTFVGGTVE